MSDAGPLAALHTAARRFCWERLAERWAVDLPAELAHLEPLVRDPFTFPLAWQRVLKEDLSSGPGDFLVYGGGTAPTQWYRERAEMLAAIIVEVERRRPEDFATEQELQAFLRAAGERARPIGTCGFSGFGPDGKPLKFARDPDWLAEQRAAAEAARAEFLAYVAGLTDDAAAAATEPMPHRRVLSEIEVARLRRACRRRWDADPTLGNWFPLKDGPPPCPREDLLAVDSHAFVREMGAAPVQDILLRRGVACVWEMGEMWPYAPAYEMETRQATFFGAETTWSSRSLGWLIYASHEDSLTFAGRWLVRAVKAAWPGWEEALYEHVVRRQQEARAGWRKETQRAQDRERGGDQ